MPQVFEGMDVEEPTPGNPDSSEIKIRLLPQGFAKAFGATDPDDVYFKLMLSRFREHMKPSERLALYAEIAKRIETPTPATELGGAVTLESKGTPA